MHLSKLISASALTMVLSVTPAFAAFTGPGGSASNTDRSATIKSAAQVANAQDDAPCLLEGYIVERVSGHNDKYNFKDATGSVVVEIDEELFRGRDIGPSDKVRLSGEVDTKTFRDSQVEVDWLEIVK